MVRRSLFWDLFPSYLLIIAITLVAVVWFGERHLSTVIYRQKAADLEALAAMAGRQVGLAAHSPAAAAGDVDRLCKELGALSLVRVTVILPSGEVAGDSATDPAAMENHASRIEVKEALAGRRGLSIRVSRTLGEKMMYVAVPLDAGEVPGAVRISVPVTAIEKELRKMHFRMVLVGVIVVILGGGYSLTISRRIVRPLEEMRKGAERLAAGDFDSRLPVPSSAELGGFAETMNRMASQLDERLKTVVQQRNEMEAVLSSMVEGVIAIDTGKSIISLNQAAVGLLAAESVAVKGKNVFEVIRHRALLDFIEDTLTTEEPLEREIELAGEDECFLQVHGSLLRDGTGTGIGALIVLNDVTRVRQLEKVRRDFVLNASHEIRTPVTSIKGFVETLLEGAIDDRENVERFLRIIARHADRLNAIVADLLNLSRIEREAERGEIPLRREPLVEVLEEALEVCRPVAAGKEILLVRHCAPDIVIPMNASLLVQAVINLVDNAVKYSDPGKTVEMSCAVDDPWATIMVRDEGSGIAEQHLPRLFERFYRVDKARSRSLGGTGLGLAIVKHIVQTHRGSVIVESEAGRGSTFTIYLPLSR